MLLISEFSDGKEQPLENKVDKQGRQGHHDISFRKVVLALFL